MYTTERQDIEVKRHKAKIKANEEKRLQQLETREVEEQAYLMENQFHKS